MSRRELVHPVERRSWWVEVAGTRIRLGMKSDDDPEELVRERTCRSAKDAQAEADALVREQLGDGFVEATPPRGDRAPAPTLDALEARWAAVDPEAPAAEWLAAARRWSPVFTDRVLAQLGELERTGREGEQAMREADTWLRMQVPVVVPGLLLALRDPRERVRSQALWVLRSPTRTWDGLPRAAEPHHLAIETAFLSLLAHPEAPPLPVAHVGVAGMLFSSHGIDALSARARAADPEQAVRAAYALAGALERRPSGAVEALLRWVERDDATAEAPAVLRRIAAELGPAGAAPPSGGDLRAAVRALLEKALRDARGGVSR